MTDIDWTHVLIAAISLYLLYRIYHRLQLSAAKHPSLRGHAKMSRRLASWVPFFSYNEQQFFASDDAEEEQILQRKRSFHQLCLDLKQQSPNTISEAGTLPSISDVNFTKNYRVPFPFRDYLNQHLKLGSMVKNAKGIQLEDLDGNWYYDLTGAYGVNLLGYDFYKECLEEAQQLTGSLGPVLGPYHPIINDNIEHIKAISGLDEVSFHMSGTEAVMQAVRLARYHTGKKRLVRFCGAYHGWWDGVQPGVGNHRQVNDVYTLNDMSEQTLKVLKSRNDIACVLINPLQALHPNSDASSDGMLMNSSRSADYDHDAYSAWLQRLEKVCKDNGIVFIMDEVFAGFRFGYLGAKDYFGVKPDMVTYGKTIGGGLPIGVVTGKAELMKRYKDDQPANVSFARGTFNSHPLVMGTMNVFLNRIKESPFREQLIADKDLWARRRTHMNEKLNAAGIPVKVDGLLSIWTVLYTTPSRYNWIYQFYLRREKLLLSWIGTGRLIFSHNYTEKDFDQVTDAFVRAGKAMLADGWWFDSQLTNADISKLFLRQMLSAKIGLRNSDVTGHSPNLIGTKTDAR